MASPNLSTPDVVASIYADAELRLIELITKHLNQGLNAPDWAIRQLSEIGHLSALAQGLIADLSPTVATVIAEALTAETMAGAATADGQISAATTAGFTVSAPAAAEIGVVNTAAVAALAAETTRTVTSTHHAILRSTQDAYRQIIAETTGRTITGVQNRRQTLQQALNRFAQQGLSGFTDRAGRRWRMDTYADMALRTSAFRAQTQGHAARLRERGYDLIVVSNHPRPAPECQPFEGKVLSLTGEVQPGRHQFDGVNGRKVTVQVVATVAQAERRGLHHPNCRHRYTLYVPGARIPEPEPYDEQGYRDEQKLRYLERKVREAKRLEAVALDDNEAKAARARIRHYQDRIRNHVASTNVARRPFREQLRTGRAENALPRVNARAGGSGGDGLASWLAAEQRYQRDVTDWLDAEQRYTSDVTDWLAAEDRYTADVTAWLAAEDAAKVAAARAAAAAVRPVAAPREFDRADGRNWAGQHWPYTTDNSPFEQHHIDAIYRYTNDEYETLNPPLRAGRTLSASNRDIVRSLDDAIERAARVPEPVVVTRTINSAGFGGIGRSESESLPGRSFTDGGFMSTSVEASGDGVLVDDRQPYLLRLTVPEGSRGVYVSAGGRGALSAMDDDENELILGRGVTYRIDRVEPPEDLNNWNTPVVVHATIVSQEAKPI